MTRRAQIQLTNKHYMNGVIIELQQKLFIGRTQATKLYIRYYRPMKRNWGFEPNVEDFADKIISIDRIVNQAKAGIVSTKNVEWIIKKTPNSQALRLTHAVVSNNARNKLKRVVLIRP